MIKDEIFAGARQAKPLYLCLCVIKRERRFLPAELTAIELPIDVERGSHGRKSFSTMLKDCLSVRVRSLIFGTHSTQYLNGLLGWILVVMALPVPVISTSNAREAVL
jgi:hypothetical protein